MPAPPLRIIIASTPKTGNTWLTHLLAAIYELPIAIASYPFVPEEVNALGERWILKQHYAADPHIIDWARQNTCHLVTTVRHPCDALVSHYHHARDLPHTVSDARLVQAAALDRDGIGDNIVEYVRTTFAAQVNLSANWVCSGASLVVRYEDLWKQPVEALTALTAAIAPVAPRLIEIAIKRCEISLLRDKSPSEKKFFRKGGCDGWQEALPGKVVDVFRELEPYPSLLRLLGYTLHSGILPELGKPTHSSCRPWSDVHFDNGVVAAPVIVDAFLARSARLQSADNGFDSHVTSGSFYEWLNSRSIEDVSVDGGEPLVSNIAAHVYAIAPLLRVSYPDLYGADRIAYVLWFLKQGCIQHALDSVFVLPVEKSFVSWAETVALEAKPGDILLPAVTNFGLFVYHSRADIRGLFPDVIERDRRKFILWFETFGYFEYGLHLIGNRPPADP